MTVESSRGALATRSNRLMAIVGPGRSGTTWAGTLVDSCPDVIYRFEPFHRLARVDAEMKVWFEKLRNGEVRDADLSRLYERLLEAHPLTNKAPFFKEKSYPLLTHARKQMWPVSRIFPPASKLYRTLYTPPPGPPVLFKEVTFIKPLQNFLDLSSVPVAYVVRHPCATVMSNINVQMRDGTSGRVQQLRAILEEQAPELACEHAEIVDGADLVSRAALLWRFEVEKCVTLVRKSANGMVMTYEQLAEDAHTEARAMFNHFGITFGPHTEQYLDMLYGLRTSRQGGPRRTGWGNKDFSVFRNPRQQKDAWKKKISTDDRRKIEAVVQGVPALEFCAALGHWW